MLIACPRAVAARVALARAKKMHRRLTAERSALALSRVSDDTETARQRQQRADLISLQLISLTDVLLTLDAQVNAAREGGASAATIARLGAARASRAKADHWSFKRTWGGGGGRQRVSIPTLLSLVQCRTCGMPRPRCAGRSPRQLLSEKTAMRPWCSWRRNETRRQRPQLLRPPPTLDSSHPLRRPSRHLKHAAWNCRQPFRLTLWSVASSEPCLSSHYLTSVAAAEMAPRGTLSSRAPTKL